MGLRSPAGAQQPAMSGWTVLAGLLALGLLIYLAAVLLSPEAFS